eukprot:TRINITY_DN14116_c0_g1_i1.p1 TRINITY_DN14116_c0_g1~~TRINITY_DN14116_c0_g1_i1.p1  ORF type:complete len:295 (-),score=68.98 TRINITY_DN14116_c0_g1_i1:115-999(-)
MQQPSGDLFGRDYSTKREGILGSGSLIDLGTSLPPSGATGTASPYSSTSAQSGVMNKIDAQFAKITNLLAETTQRLIATENRVDSLTRKSEERDQMSRDIAQRVNDVAAKQDSLVLSMSELQQIRSALLAQQQQHAPPPLPPPMPVPQPQSIPPPAPTYSSQSFSQEPLYQLPPSQQPGYTQHHQPPPPPPQQSQQPLYRPVQAPSQPAPPPKSSVQPAVQFDEQLVTDACALGYPRFKVIDTLNKLYAAGKSCNDINVLIDCLEKGGDVASAPGGTKPAAPAGDKPKWQFWKS